MPMTQESSDPDLNLQLLNDHGIYTIEEINELSRTVKLFCTTQNLVHFLIILNSETYGILKRENFKFDLRRENWDSNYKCNEVNEIYSRFLHIFNKVRNIHAPLKKAKIKHKAYKLWITSGLINPMKVRDKLYKKWLITRNYVFLNKFKLYRNKIATINKIYRDHFYNDILTKSDNTKMMWDNINLLINNIHVLSLLVYLKDRF